MKKLFYFIIAIVAFTAFTGFVICQKDSIVDKMDNNWIYYCKATGWRDSTESETMYIFYKQGNGVREYAYSRHSESGPFLTITKNKLYRSPECKDFRRNYRYVGGWALYFNANLPYMEN